ncbi:MAG: molybdate ABC transporter substrate-binding protein [Dissulfurimicrobium sp.]|uniref:molybdate ABC transporter substrate-binding protein n=2 Tax=Dissulfurimicrobium sp. TaxID=2022436 RepID=UPI004048F8D7
MKVFKLFMVVIVVGLLDMTALPGNALSAERLMVFAGSASKPPTEEVAKAFEKKTGVKVDISFGGSGTVLSQMMLAKEGDIYFPGSSDYMELAKRKGAVFPETEKVAVYLVPAINVQKGNPKGIHSLKDLTRHGLKVAIANPESVCVGAYAVEIIEKSFTPQEKEAFKKNLINYTESCDKTATAISLKMADAVIGWRVFQYWDPERIETIPLKKEDIVRVGYIPIAISKFTKNRELAQRFIDFILSDEGKAIFRKYNYLMTPDETFAYIGEKKPVGGEYVVPKEWVKK